MLPYHGPRMTSGSQMSFGLALPQRGALFGATTTAQLLDLSRRTDANPLFDTLWVGDSLYAKPRPDSLTLLGGLATITQRVRLGVGCMASFPVRDPLIFAYQWATLDWLSGGRVQLAVCTGIVGGGASAREGKAWGVEDKQRARRMTENIDICRKLWGNEHTGFDGEFTSFEQFDVAPKPIQQPCPIWIAANPSPKNRSVYETSLKRVAHKADGWMTVELFPNMFRGMWHLIKEYLADEGKDPATFPNIEYHNFNINEDKQAGYLESQQFLDAYYGPVFNEGMVRCWTALGSPQECIDHIRALRDSGAKAITFRATSYDQDRQFRRLTEEVLPFV
jgi:alkanesulfonate monooxygenase SsuD/methylene tetrahydromethanopterin reductase-like flavin-dependent oxidoreductase (luciferase family)